MTGVISEAGHFLNYLACMCCVGQKVPFRFTHKIVQKNPNKFFSPTQYHHGKKRRRRNIKVKRLSTKSVMESKIKAKITSQL